MSKQSEREQFVHVMAQEGVSLPAAQALMRAATTLHRLAELECSSEAADRDRVKCPGTGKVTASCLCADYGSRQPGDGHAVHAYVPRIVVQAARVEARVVKLLKPLAIRAEFNGDPRGAVIRLHVPSGKDEFWGGVAVP